MNAEVGAGVDERVSDAAVRWGRSSSAEGSVAGLLSERASEASVQRGHSSSAEGSEAGR